jgi:hypothetical protein
LLLGSIGCLADTQLIHAETSCDPFVVDFYVSDGSPSNCIERETAANTMIAALELGSQVRKVVLKFPNRTQDPPANALHFIGMVLRNSGDDTFTTNVATELASSISPELRQLNASIRFRLSFLLPAQFVKRIFGRKDRSIQTNYNYFAPTCLRSRPHGRSRRLNRAVSFQP